MVDNLLFIDGTFRPSAQSGILEVINPATEEPCATVACASGEDVEEAVAAAKKAQHSLQEADMALILEASTSSLQC